MGNNWRAPQVQAQRKLHVRVQASEATTGNDAGHRRLHLPPDTRRRVVNKITNTLKDHIPFAGEDELQELERIAVRFEGKMYTSATSLTEYLRKISLKMVVFENSHQRQ